MHLARLLQAIALASAVILSAPYTAVVRLWLRETFPGNFVLVVGVIITAAIATGIVYALTRIRDRRVLRFSLLASAIVIGVSYALWAATGQSEVDVVERFHFVEYGLVAFAFYRAFKPAGDWSILVLTLLSGLIAGTIEEWFQWFIPNRVGELHDVALNLVAVGCGLLFTIGADPPASFSWRLHSGSSRRIATGVALAIGALGFFVSQVHLGHEVRTTAGAMFRSHWTADQLRALSAERASRWKTDPPRTFKRLSREDQYMDEAMWHIRARNLAWGSNFATAWAENAILEEFYAPVLDTPTYAAPEISRWPDAQKREAEEKSAGDRAPFVSHAEQYPIIVW